MVKIINTLGDKKTGVQGPAVYQGHYGHQIRRVKAPKGAPSSTAQLKHRDLFRLSLAWKKTLTPHDKAWLKFHAIDARIIDSFKVPLTWNRYADKICLTRPTFRLSTIGEPPSLLLQIEHPALLYVLHSRDTTTQGKWDKLSDLPGEYITTGLHLDVKPQDHIEVKTLPGVIYHYTVPGKELLMKFTETWAYAGVGTGSGVWETLDLSAILPEGTKAVFVVIYSPTTLVEVGARKPGQTYQRRLSLGGGGVAMVWSLLTECDEQRHIQYFSDVTMQSHFFVAGYWVEE